MSGTEPPVEQTDGGQYPVVAPFEDAEPASIEIRVDGQSVLFSEYAGKQYKSVFNPDVLLYEQCTVVSEGENDG